MRRVIHHHKTFHPRTVDQQRQVVGRAFDRFLVVVLADRAADNHPRLHVQTAQHRIEDVAANVIEIHIDAFRAFAFKPGHDIFGLVVDGTVKTQLINKEFALVGAAGNANHAAAFELGNLPGDAAHCARCTGQHHGVAGLRCADIQQGEVGGHAGHAQR
ncbi:hypothetical protein D3C84_272180 [compost metagenome]